MPDVLHSGLAGFRYWRNLGGGLLDRPQSMSQIPAGIALAQPGVGFGDMGGDGRADLLVHSGPLQGFFETTSDGTWQKFKPYDLFPSFDLADANVRLVDLTGDGSSDALMTRDQHFLWFECLGEKGFAPPKHVPRKHDLDQFPDVFFDDPAGRVRLADMTGDGLNDIVLIHNGRIDYWPNLGYGHFRSYSVLSPKPGSNQASERLSKERRGDKPVLSRVEGTCWTKPRSRSVVSAVGILTHRDTLRYFRSQDDSGGPSGRSREDPVKAVNDLAEDLQEDITVPILVEDVFPRVAARGHMVQRAVKFYSETTSHDLAQVARRATKNKIQDLTPKRPP
jgi:hypothetical protein